jgi:hypothetical protein
VKTEFKSSFVKDPRGIKSRKIHERVKALIELVESVADLSAIVDLKKLHGAGAYFRVHVGEYHHLAPVALRDARMSCARYVPRTSLEKRARIWYEFAIHSFRRVPS